MNRRPRRTAARLPTHVAQSTCALRRRACWASQAAAFCARVVPAADGAHDPFDKFRAQVADALEELHTLTPLTTPLVAVPLPEERTPRHYEDFAPAQPRFP